MSDPSTSGTAVSLEHEDLSEELRRIWLGGRMDMIGVGEIELPFTALAASRPVSVLVDLTGVTFLASVGLRCIIQSAKALDLKGGRMALLVGDNPLVRGTLETVGVGEIIPMFSDEAAALQSLSVPAT
ncbi:MAG: STAS domain-containing protein [Cyanobium sp. ELA507]